jgi:flagellar protein FliO/FliZ
MPRKLCFATLLVSSLLIGNCLAQEFHAEEFGAKVAARLTSRPANLPPGDVPGNVTPLGPNEKPSPLVRPAIQQPRSGYVADVQQASHSEPIPTAQDRLADLENGSPLEPPSALQSDAAFDRDLGFPALGPPSESRRTGSGTAPSTQGLGSVVTVISSLAVVLGLFFMTAWLMRRSGPGGLATLPGDVFESLGRAQLSNRQQVHLVRCGTKLLLVSVTPDGAETLTEIDDPDEVTRLTGLCKANQAGSTTAAFRQVLHQFAGQPAEPGFVGRSDSRTTRRELPSELENLHG